MIQLPLLMDFFGYWARKLWAIKTVRYGLVAIAALGVTGYISYSSGYSAHEKVALEQQADDLRHTFETYSDEVKRQNQYALIRAERDRTLIADMFEETGRIRSVSTKLEGHIHELAEASSTLSISVGAVRLLNDAKASSVVGAGGDASGATSGASYSDPSPSSVGLGGLIADGVLTATQYNVMRAQCTALQDWTKRELIDENKRRAAIDK